METLVAVVMPVVLPVETFIVLMFSTNNLTLMTSVARVLPHERKQPIPVIAAVYATWIRSTLCDPDRFFNIDGGINVHEFSPKHFRDFLLAKMNTANSLKVTTLGDYRSAVKDIYRKQQLPLRNEYADDMKNIFACLKRIEATRNQTGPGEAKKAGKMALPYSVYEHACKKTLVLPDGGFAHVFLTLQWNLMCRSQSVETIHSGHLSNDDDSVGIVFHKSKANQDGNGPKDPRHIYSNPLAPWTCCITALGLYWSCCPRQGPGPIFPGSLQRNRFRKAFSRAIGQPGNQTEYGTHSIRKGVATYACNGSTGGPSIVSVCLRCGWSLGGVQDRYFRYESAGDQFLGRVVAGLPVNSAQFAILPPHFQDNSSGVVCNAVKTVFPMLAEDNELQPILKLSLASLVFHYDYFSSVLPNTHPFRASSLFRLSDMRRRLSLELMQQNSSWMTATGIPPQVVMFGLQQQIQSTVCSLPDALAERFTRMLEEKGICGHGITQQQLEETMRKILGERAETPSSHSESESSRITSRTTVHFWPRDGKLHTLPETFEFPSTDMLHAWLMWWFGNEGMGFHPLRSVSTSDLSTRKKRLTYSEWRVMMQHISQAVEQCTGKALPTSMTQQQATALCITGVNSLRLGGAARRRRATQLKITTMLRLVREAKHVERSTHVNCS